jgi:CheY-like chemotaxis protein
MKLDILLVDDDVVGNLLLSTILNDLPFISSYKIATSVTEALLYLEEKKSLGNFPNLMLVDLKMPEKDGFEFIKICECKFPEFLERKSFVVLSSSVREMDKKVAIEHNSVIEFISKPLTEDQLIRLADIISEKGNTLINQT